MRKVNVAIVSKRRELIRFFELEALNFGFKVSSFERMPTDLACFDLLIVDAMVTCQISPLFNGRLILISDGESSSVSEGAEHLPYPTPIGALRYAYKQVAYGEGAVDRLTDREMSRACILFYRELENTVGYCGRTITLSDHEMKILKSLCESVGEAVGREELNALLGASGGNIADVYVCRLRKKLEEIDGRRVIFTVRSKGYKITADMEWK